MRRTRTGEGTSHEGRVGPGAGPGAGPGPGPGPSNRTPGSYGTGPARTVLPIRTAAHPADQDVPGAVRQVLKEILRERVEDCASLDPTFTEDIAERVAEFTLDGGKRLRAQFLWWGLRACGGGGAAGEADTALRLAAGLELIQTCALLHDDVMDGSAFRRGKPTLHVALAARYGAARGGPGEPFGRAAAVLAGDLALSWADDTVAEAWDAQRVPRDVRRRVRGVWRAMRTEMVAGQYLDLHGQVTGTREVSVAVRTATLKSALYSVERPLALGAALAGADERTTRALCAAGRSTGIAFQLRDDLLGVFGDPRKTGKPSGDDIRDGKHTYLTAVARARAERSGDRAVTELLDASLGDASLSEEGLERVREALVRTGARDLVQGEIARLVTVADRHLTSVPLVERGENGLRGLLGAVAATPPGTHGRAHPPPHPESRPRPHAPAPGGSFQERDR